MSRKDYIIIAEALKSSRYGLSNPAFHAGIDKAVLNLVEVLKAENPRFDEARFLSAAEFGKLPRLEEVA